jgi:putative ABC transport system substrate-binding protein
VSLRILRLTILAAACYLAGAAYAEDLPQGMRIGVLLPQMADSPLEKGLRLGLADVGYVETKNISIEWRPSPQVPEDLSSRATDLVKSNVAVIVAIGPPAARAAFGASSTIPIVFTTGDAIAAGFVTNLAKPDRNGTGVSFLAAELHEKSLEMLHELTPRARRIMYLVNPANPLSPQDRVKMRVAADSLGLELITIEARSIDELRTGLRRVHRGAAHALVVQGDLVLLGHRAEIARAVRAARIPAIFPYGDYHEAGVLMSYGPSWKSVMRIVAGYVDRLLKGAQPRDLPIQQLSKYDLTINLVIARDLGIEVPNALLLRADELIK